MKATVWKSLCVLYKVKVYCICQGLESQLFTLGMSANNCKHWYKNMVNSCFHVAPFVRTKGYLRVR